LRLGVVTDTQDLTGRVLSSLPVAVDEESLRAEARMLVGEQDQVPPMVSALRVRGQRLYRLARRGEVVERAARRVSVLAWEWGEIALPEARFRVRCSAGTYVRTLVHDLGQRLGCGGALASLRRLRSEPFGLNRALSWRDLDALTPEQAWARAGIPLAEALSVLPSLTVDAGGEEAVGRGAAVALAEAPAADVPLNAGPRSVVVRTAAGLPLALGELTRGPEPGGPPLVRPHVVFPWAVREG